ncbi:membrane protein porin [Musa troglodytarum]|uniref:Membrane protein porin n=1 Tax=Musa troglodytarum TaxID=320322 RepID=A0A9E7HSA4_9LILI|nr:membrane protein porin [Musa troglodytarum]
MGPGLYSAIGKKARHLLYKDCQTDHKFTVTPCTANGVHNLWDIGNFLIDFLYDLMEKGKLVKQFTASGTRKNDLIFGEIQSQIKNNNITFDVKTNSDSNVTTTVTINELATPGLKTIFSFDIPDQRSGKVELQYLHDYAGVNASIGLTANPVVNFSSGVVGSKTVSVGADVAFDTATGNFIKYNAGLSIANAGSYCFLGLCEYFLFSYAFVNEPRQLKLNI